MDEVAVKVEGVKKRFKIPHEKQTSLKSAALGMFKKKTYTTLEALNDVSFEVKKGEFFGIIGRNGSGKSTLLKSLAGIYTPNSGKITINGKLSPFLELGVGFHPELTGRENVFLGGAILGLTRKEIAAKFESIVKFSELEEFIDMKFKNYSSGMQVRLAFALSINAHAEILLMDEVLAVGDSNFQSKCLREFKRYRDQGKTVILVSHDITTVQRYCDKALLLRNGKVVMSGNTEEVIDEYVYQNMSDEEKRQLTDVKDGANGEEDKDKKSLVKIDKVEVLDAKRISKTVFETGSEVTIRIILSRKSQENINVGVGLYAEDGSYVLGYNTQMEEYMISKNSNEVNIIFKNLPLLKGRYYLNVVCFGSEENNYFDYKPKIKTIEFFSTDTINSLRGFVNVDHQWTQGSK